MRKALRLILFGVTLLLLARDARAQPAAPQPRPERDGRCREAALRHIHPSPDKPHLTVEAEADYEYRGRKMYLRVCDDSDDDFTRSVKASVASHEAARRCETVTWPQYSARVKVEDSAPPEGQKQAYEAAQEYLKVCGRYEIESVWLSTSRVEQYEEAARVEEAERARPAGSRSPPGRRGSRITTPTGAGGTTAGSTRRSRAPSTGRCRAF